MNDLIKKHALKTALNLIGEDTVVNGITEILNRAIEKKQSMTLDEGETDTIAIAYEQSGRVYGAIATVNENRQIIRIIEPKEIEKLALQLLKSI